MCASNRPWIAVSRIFRLLESLCWDVYTRPALKWPSGRITWYFQNLKDPAFQVGKSSAIFWGSISYATNRPAGHLPFRQLAVDVLDWFITRSRLLCRAHTGLTCCEKWTSVKLPSHWALLRFPEGYQWEVEMLCLIWFTSYFGSYCRTYIIRATSEQILPQVLMQEASDTASFPGILNKEAKKKLCKNKNIAPDMVCVCFFQVSGHPASSSRYSINTSSVGVNYSNFSTAFIPNSIVDW